ILKSTGVLLSLVGHHLLRLKQWTKNKSQVLQQMQQVCIYLGNKPGEGLFVADEQCFWKLKNNVDRPESRGNKWGGKMSNSLGFRNPEFSLDKAKSTRRIVCYGDSTTFGFGVRMHESWPALLECDLNRTGSSPVEVVNAGVPGYSIFQGNRYLARSLPQLAPDLVIATFGNNDAWRWDDRSDREHAARRRRGSVRWNWRRSRALTAFSKLTTPCLDSVSTTDAAWARRVSSNFFQPVAAWRPRVNLQEFADNLDKMVRVCHDRGIQLVLLVWPDYFQVQGRLTIRNRYQDLIRRTADRHDGVGCVDLLPVFRSRYPASLQYYLDQDIIHINAAGNTVVAATIRQLLQEILPLADARR
ncbi:MAG: GDSL-type esterase/lipase family protein, partial [Planctomycetaceae bacterium]